MVDIEKIFSRVFILHQIIGLTFLRQRNAKLIRSKFAIIQTLIFLLVYIILAFFYLSNFSKKMNKEFRNIKTLKFIANFRYISYVCLVVITFLTNFRRDKQMLTIINKILKIDKELVKLGQKNSIIKSNKLSSKYFIWLVIIINFFFNIVVKLITCFGKPNNRIFYFILVAYSKLIISTTGITFYIFSKILYERFNIVNNVLTKCHIFKVRSTIFIHLKLVKICREVNSIFSLHVLILFSFYFICWRFIYVFVYNIF